MTLATAAQIRGIHSKNLQTKEFWFHRGKAMAILNKNLSTLEHGITDAMIYTVSMLAYTDVCFTPVINVYG